MNSIKLSLHLIKFDPIDYFINGGIALRLHVELLKKNIIGNLSIY